MILSFKNRSLLYRVSRFIGIVTAFIIVVLWFPHTKDMWTYPIQQIDAPAHYYFVRKILDEGVGAALRLWPNDAYYPPFFHLLVAGLVQIANFVGIKLGIVAAFNIIWIVISGLVWPIGCQLLGLYWAKKINGKIEAENTTNSWIILCAVAIVIPTFAVSSPSHPYWMLNAGPLIAFGMATSLLPLWLYVSLQLLDNIQLNFALRKQHVASEQGENGKRALIKKACIKYIALSVVMMGLCLFAHPRIAFTWLLFIMPFILIKLPKKLIAGVFAVCVLGAGAFFGYMVTHYQSSRYLNPGSWFHTFKPTRTVPEALKILVTDNIDGLSGIVVGVVAVASFVIVIGTPALAKKMKLTYTAGESIAILLQTVLVSTVYICSAAVTGWFANIVTAVWYRGETRPITMLPLLYVFLFSYAISIVWKYIQLWNKPLQTIASWFVIVAMLVPVLLCQIHNPQRNQLHEALIHNTSLYNDNPHEQMTEKKYEVLEDISKRIGTDDVVISDPLNGSMYGMAAFGTNMLYPIYNPMAEKNGAIFGQVERAFDSANPKEVLQTVCPISPNGDEYFLTMGPQAPSLQMFTFKEQYDPFHNEAIISKYEKEGVLKEVKDYQSLVPKEKNWKLYKFECE